MQPGDACREPAGGQAAGARRQRGQPSPDDRRAPGERGRRLELSRGGPHADGARRGRVRPGPVACRSTPPTCRATTTTTTSSPSPRTATRLPRAVGRAPGRGPGPARAVGRRPGRAGALDPAVGARRRSRLLGHRAAALEPPSVAVPARVRDGVARGARRPAFVRCFLYLVLAFALVLFVTREGWPPAPRGGALAAAGARGGADGARDRRRPGRSAAARCRSRARRPPRSSCWRCCAAGSARARRRRTAGRSSSPARFGALLAFACFYNLGRPQFWHHGERRPMFVHAGDMRIYQPFVKYLRRASLRRHLPGQRCSPSPRTSAAARSPAIAGTRVRDLRDFRLRTGRRADRRDRQGPAAVLARAVGRVQARHRVLPRGDGARLPDTLDDHGANAPPAWVWVARLFLGHVTASETTLTLAGLFDAVLFLAMAWAIVRSVRPAADAGGDDGVRRDRALHVRHQLGGRDAAPRLAGAAGVRGLRAAAAALAARGRAARLRDDAARAPRRRSARGRRARGRLVGSPRRLAAASADRARADGAAPARGARARWRRPRPCWSPS